MVGRGWWVQLMLVLAQRVGRWRALGLVALWVALCLFLIVAGLAVGPSAPGPNLEWITGLALACTGMLLVWAGPRLALRWLERDR